MNPLVSEKKENPPILIVDKTGIIGVSLAEKILGDAQVVLVSEKEPISSNVIFVPFSKKFPVIPNSIYSHIFIIEDDDLITHESLPSFLKKTQDDRSTLTVISHIKNQNLISNDLLEYKGSRVVFYQDVVDKNLAEGSYINKFINQTKIKGKINVPGDGMQMTRPIFFDDLISGILESAFGTSSEKIYYLMPKHGVTLLSFAHMIQKSNPSVKVDFIKIGVNEDTKILREGKYLLPLEYPLEEKIRNLKIETSNTIDISEEEDNKLVSKFGDKKIIRTTIFFLILFVFMPLISTLIFLLFGTIFINSVKINLNSADFNNASNSVNISKSIFSFSKKTSSLLVWETGGSGFFKSLESSSDEGYKMSLGISDFFQGTQFLEENKISQAVEFFKNFLIFAQTQNANNKKLDLFNEKLFNIATATVDVWPQMLGFDSKKNYLILMQNNLKLRPGGGLIESYAVMIVNKGRIENFSIKNAYDSDKNLKGHVEPPYPIRRFIGQKDWFLKDSNFDVDFRQVASSAAFFVNLETDEKIDGVIAIDLNFVKNVLKITGPIFLPEYKISINSENIFKETETRAADKKFLTIVFNSLKSSFEEKRVSYLEFVKFLGDMIYQKDVLFSSSDQNVQNIFTVNNLSNSLWDGRLNTSKSINDFIGISEANIGIYENTLIKRKMSQAVEIKDTGEISVDSSLELNNQNNFDYISYLRFVLPKGSELKGIKINGEDKNLINAVTDPALYEESSFKSPVGLEVESYDEEGKTIIGFLVTVPKNKSQTIELNYSQISKPPLISLGNFSYSLHFLKQSGVDSYNFDLSLNIPKTWRALAFPKGVSSNAETISFTKNVSEDFELNLDFSQK